MKARIAAGETIETTTPTEFEDVLRRVLGEASSEWMRGPETVRMNDGITLDGNGNGTLNLYAVPAGMEFALHRLFVGDDSHTPANPYTNANGYIYLLRNDMPEDFANLSLASGGFPALKRWSGDQALRFRNKEIVKVQFVGGPAFAAVLVRAQGTLQPLTGS